MHYGESAKNDAATIAAEVIRDGHSSGWTGTVGQRERCARILRPFGIVYLDDMNGEWGLSRASIAERANHIASDASRRGAPRLDETSVRPTLIAWLVWCDPNGVWTDEDRDRDEYERLSVWDAWDQIHLMTEEG